MPLLPVLLLLAAAPQPQRVEAVLREQMAAAHAPGLAFLAVQDGRVTMVHTLGYRDVQKKLPVSADTLFPIGSCTKAFTSMAVALSQDEGKLSFDDRPHRYLPYFRLADPEADALVTLRDMLAHRTGLRAYADLAAEPAVLTREQYVRAATAARPVARLRERFQYSNAMYSAVGEVLARVQGVPWEKAVERAIFAPLGMNASVATLKEIAPGRERAVPYGYSAETQGWTAQKWPESLGALAPGGSIASTANDMGRWLLVLAGSGVREGRRFVSEEAFAELTRPHIRIDDARSYALGWANYTWNGHAVVEHNGGSRGISALVSFIPGTRTGFVLLANLGPNPMTRIGVMGKLLWPILLGEEAPAEAPPAPAPAAAPSPAAPAEASPLPAVDELLRRMVQAAGGERNQRRHTALELRGTRRYENHGVAAALSVSAQAPDRRTEEEVWSAAGIRIGRVKTWFDGKAGGQETTFGQDESYTAGEPLEKARRDATLHPLLDLRGLYPTIKLERRGTVDGQDTYVLDLVPATGKPVALHVSARTALVVKRETDTDSTVYSDYRNVDGEIIPFRSVAQEPLGEITTVVESVRFN